MSLPPQEPPRGPPPLKVSQNSHKIKKQPPHPSAGASQSHHHPAPLPLEDYLASLEQQLMNELIPPEVVSTQTVPSLNEFGSASNILPNQPESFPSGEGSFLPNPPPSRSIPGPWTSLPPPAVAVESSIERMMPVNSPAAGSSFWPSAWSEYSPSASSSAASTPSLEFSLPSGSDGSFFSNPPPPPDYLPPTPAAEASSFLPSPPPSRSIPGPWTSLPPHTVSVESSIEWMMPVNSPAAGSSFWPSASSEYSPSAASLPPESSPDGSCYDGVDSTPPPSPPPDPSA